MTDPAGKSVQLKKKKKKTLNILSLFLVDFRLTKCRSTEPQLQGSKLEFLTCRRRARRDGPGLGPQEIRLPALCGPPALFPTYCFDSDYFWKQDNGLLATEFSPGAAGKLGSGDMLGAAVDRNLSPGSLQLPGAQICSSTSTPESSFRFRRGQKDHFSMFTVVKNREVREKEFC